MQRHYVSHMRLLQGKPPSFEMLSKVIPPDLLTKCFYMNIQYVISQVFFSPVSTIKLGKYKHGLSQGKSFLKVHHCTIYNGPRSVYSIVLHACLRNAVSLSWITNCDPFQGGDPSKWEKSQCSGVFIWLHFSIPKVMNKG